MILPGDDMGRARSPSGPVGRNPEQCKRTARRSVPALIPSQETPQMEPPLSFPQQPELQ